MWTNEQMQEKMNKVHHAEASEFLSTLPDGCIDLTVTSPPYDNLRTYNGYTFDFEAIAKQLYRVTKDGGAIVWVVGDATIKGSETGTSFKQALYFKEIGFNLHDTMIWAKDTTPYHMSNRYYQCFEYMFVFTKGAIGTFNAIQDRKNKHGGSSVYGTTRDPNGKTRIMSANKYGEDKKIKEYGVRFNYWLQPTEKQSNKIGGHPAMFPEQLANDHIISWSNEGDLVLDCFMGSGTTAKMAKVNKRNFIGCDMSSEYIDIANKRLEAVQGSLF